MSELLMIIVILIPVIGGSLIPFLPLKNRKIKCIYIEVLVILNSLIVMYLLFNRPEERFEIVNFVSNLSLSLRMDGMSMVFGGLIAALWPFATLFAFELDEKITFGSLLFPLNLAL